MQAARLRLDSSAIERRDPVDYVLQLFLLQFRKNRQGQDLVGGTLGVRKIPVFVPQVGKAWLPVQRHGIVNLRSDTAFGQEPLECVASRRADHVLIPGVTIASSRGRQLNLPA